MTIGDGTHRGTVDRIVGEFVALLVPGDEETLEQFEMTTEELAAFDVTLEEGDVAHIEIADEEIVVAERRPDETRDRREQLCGRFDRLSERPSDRD